MHSLLSGAVDIDSITDAQKRKAVQDQIRCYGQTPSQLYRRPHPPRLTGEVCLPAVIAKPTSMRCFVPPRQREGSQPIVFIVQSRERIVAVHRDGSIAQHTWQSGIPDGKGMPLTFFCDASATSTPSLVNRRHSARANIGVPFGSLDLGTQCFAALELGSKLSVLSCGHLDFSFQLTCVDSSKPADHLSIANHQALVTCLAITDDHQYVLSGSRDTSVMVWPVLSRQAFSTKPRHVLCGHQGEVCCLVASTELDIVVSGSVDATCIVHTLARGQYVRCIRHPLHFPVDRIALSAHDGSFVIYSNMADAHEQRVTPYPTKYAICDRTATALFGRVVSHMHAFTRMYALGHCLPARHAVPTRVTSACSRCICSRSTVGSFARRVLPTKSQRWLSLMTVRPARRCGRPCHCIARGASALYTDWATPTVVLCSAPQSVFPIMAMNRIGTQVGMCSLAARAACLPSGSSQSTSVVLSLQPL